MSIKAVAWALDVPEVSPLSKLILICLAEHANAEYQCWPSTTLIVQRTNVSRSTVFRHLGSLEKTLLITRTRRFSDNGRKRSTVYVLAVEGCQSDTGDGVTVTPLEPTNIEPTKSKSESVLRTDTHSAPPSPPPWPPGISEEELRVHEMRAFHTIYHDAFHVVHGYRADTGTAAAYTKQWKKMKERGEYVPGFQELVRVLGLMLRAQEYRTEDGELFGVPSAARFLRDELWRGADKWHVALYEPQTTIVRLGPGEYADTRHPQDAGGNGVYKTTDIDQPWWPLYLEGIWRLGQYGERSAVTISEERGH